MEPSLNRRRSIVFPMLLIGLGIVFLLSNLKILTGSFWEIAGRWWPVLFIVFSFDEIYRRGSIIGPAFWAGLGGILLAINLNYLSGDIWDIFIRFWPLILILAGAEILLGYRLRTAWGAGISLLGVLAVLGGIVWYSMNAPQWERNLQSQIYALPLDDSKSAQVNIAPGAARVKINAQEDSSSLVKVVIQSVQGEEISQSQQVTAGVGEVSLSNDRMTVVHPGIGNPLAKWNILLNKNVPIDLHFDLGLGDATLDLSSVKLSLLEAKVGVGMFTLLLPNTGPSTVRIESAIGETKIVIPAGIQARVTTSNAIALLGIEGSLNKNGNIVTTPGFDENSNRLEIHVQQAIGLVIVKAQ